jgi:nitrite reductase/ring-hydroxylating ferredoxin subunit
MAQPEPPDRDDAPDVFAEVDHAIARLQAHADPAVRTALEAVLRGVDGVHRAGLTHLVHALHGLGGETLINRLIADPAIRMLLMSYDLIATDRRLQAEEALDTVRGHLHDHGVDVEIQEVVGGVVYVRLHVDRDAPRPAPPTERIRADLEAALREYLIGFQELELRDRNRDAPPAAVIPPAAILRANRPVYADALAADELPEGSMRAAAVNGISVLFARVEGQVYAVRDQCGDSPLPLALGTLDGGEVHCSWHGCRYDVRSGRRLDGEGRLQVLPTAIEEGRIRVAVDVVRGAG